MGEVTEAGAVQVRRARVAARKIPSPARERAAGGVRLQRDPGDARREREGALCRSHPIPRQENRPGPSKSLVDLLKVHTGHVHGGRREILRRGEQGGDPVQGHHAQSAAEPRARGGDSGDQNRPKENLRRRRIRRGAKVAQGGDRGTVQGASRGDARGAGQVLRADVRAGQRGRPARVASRDAIARRRPSRVASSGG